MSLRTRLTMIYGGLFLVGGIVLLGTTYALFNQEVSRSGAGFSVKDQIIADSAASKQPSPVLRTKDGQILTGQDARKWLDAQEERIRDSAMTSLITQGGVALLIVGAAAAGLGWLVAGRVLAPLHQVTQTARRIASAPAADRGLHERITLRGPDDEVKDLADTFDTMVERLDRSFDGQRRFVANASHELRTPLTLGRALIELALRRKGASTDVKELGSDLLEINARHEQLIAGLLVLAGAENEVPDRRPIDLADVIEHVRMQIAAEAEQFDVEVRVDAQEAVAAGDALLLERLVHNLVENGIQHNLTSGGWVRAVSRRSSAADQVEVEVTNTGPVMAPYDVPALFEPFRRFGTEELISVRGAGLGLSIVRAIARAHGGSVEALPRDGGGLIVTAILPRWQEFETIAKR
jgi:signal transduction histidine kinase